ncbi:hypothetical protein DFLDMN_000291 [Cupriavidus sp. H19C3]|uniref:hypothetical protein n=1 Tax=Cupriavidus sp. H19C3 TaxID=3241603 RepID=UPI003BF91314
MTYQEALDVAQKAMEDAVGRCDGDDIELTKALAEATQDPVVAQAFEIVGMRDLLAEQNTKH